MFLLRSLRTLALHGTALYLHTTGVVVTYEYSLLKLVLDQGIQMDSSQLVSLAPPLPLLRAVRSKPSSSLRSLTIYLSFPAALGRPPNLRDLLVRSIWAHISTDCLTYILYTLHSCK